MDTLISIDPKPIYLFTPDEVKTMLWRIFKGGADKIDYIGPDKKNNLRFEVTLNNYDDQELDLDSETYKTLEMLEDMGELDSHFYRGKFYITFNKSDMERKAMSTMNEKAGKEVITEGKAETAIIDYLNNHPGATSKDIILAVYGRDSDQLKGSSLLMAPIRAIARAIQVGSVTKDDSQRPSKYFAKSATTVQPKLTKPLVKLAGEFAVLDLLKQRGTQGATAKDFMPFFKS